MLSWREDLPTATIKDRAEPYHAFSPILTSFDKSEKFRAVIYFNFGVLLQAKGDLIPETE